MVLTTQNSNALMGRSINEQEGLLMAKGIKYICVVGCAAGGVVLKPGDEVGDLDPDKVKRLVAMGRIAPSDSDEAKEVASQVKKTKVKKSEPAPEVMPGLDGE